MAIDLEPERGDILADYAFLLQQVGSGLHYPDCYRLAATRLWLHGASQCRAFGPAACGHALRGASMLHICARCCMPRYHVGGDFEHIEPMLREAHALEPDNSTISRGLALVLQAHTRIHTRARTQITVL